MLSICSYTKEGKEKAPPSQTEGGAPKPDLGVSAWATLGFPNRS